MDRLFIALVVILTGAFSMAEDWEPSKPDLEITELGVRIRRPLNYMGGSGATMGTIKNLGALKILVRCVYSPVGEGEQTQWMEVIEGGKARRCTINDDGAFYVYDVPLDPTDPPSFRGFIRVNLAHREPSVKQENNQNVEVERQVQEKTPIQKVTEEAEKPANW